MTVSRVINNSPGVSGDARGRVQQSIDRLSYVPNRLARGLIQRKTGVFSVVIPDIANPFFAQLLRGVEHVAWKAGYHVFLCDTQGDLAREQGCIEDMLAFRAEGVLIAPVGDRSRPHLELLTRNAVPFVLIDRSVAGCEVDLVQGDSVGGARQLIEHLLELGHTRIGMVTESSDVSTARDRLTGYRQALAAAGLLLDPDLVVVSSAIDHTVARDSTLQLLDLADPPTAIFAVNNVAVIGVTEAARERGLSIPDDLTVVCFDDMEHLSRMLDPFLTAITQPAETFGTIATQLLLDRLTGRSGEAGRKVVLSPELIIRRSSVALAKDRTD